MKLNRRFTVVSHQGVAVGYHSSGIHNLDGVSFGVSDDRAGYLFVNTVNAENDDERTAVFTR